MVPSSPMDPILDPTLVEDHHGSSEPSAVSLPGGREHGSGEALDGRYRLGVRLGRGGFGDVWRAQELLPDGAPFREVALKLLVSDFADEAHWAEEAKLLASFRHPSLVTVYAAGILGGAAPAPFVAMELLEGVTLVELLRQRGTIPWRRVLAWARDVAGALDVIHGRGVVHLDLKPANLFLTQEGAVKVLDFGISRRAGGPAPAVRVVAGKGGASGPRGTLLHDRQHDAYAATRPAQGGEAGDRTKKRGVVGTPGFIAPEVLALEEPTAATDAYALGVCIAQLVTGRLPQAVRDEPEDWTDPRVVSAWWAELRGATLQGSLRDFEGDPARMPRGVLGLLERLLAVRPADRRVQAGQLRRLLDEVWERPHGMAEPPYFGLSALPAEAEGLLFGRDDDVARLGRELEFEPCVVLQGPRGAGKSSLARAGLVPSLGRKGVDQKDDWIEVLVRPGAAPDEALWEALPRAVPALGGADLERIAAFCAASPVGLALVVDPLEELAEAIAREPEASGGEVRAPAGSPARLEQLLAWVASGGAPKGLRVVGVLGEDKTAALLATPLGACLRGALRYVGPPGVAAVKELVAGPARLSGAELRGLELVVPEVQRELRSGGAALPFVALALGAWWGTRERRKGEGLVLHGEAWRGLGGIRGALARHADGVMAGLPRGQRAVADEVLLRLGAMDERGVRWDEGELIEAVGGAAGEVAQVLGALERAYLVRRQRGGVEIAHEALLSSWPHLRTIRGLSLERLVLLERVREAGDAWERSGNHRDFLLRGDLLKQVLRSEPVTRGLARRERELLAQSRRRAWWRRAANGGVGVGVALALAGAIGVQRMVERQQRAAEQAQRAAEWRADLAEVIGRSRRTEDPFQRTAWAVEAMARGSTDPMLPLELAVAARGVPRAQFLTLEPVSGAAVPWGERWVLGGGPGGTLFVADLRPPQAEVIEDLDLDVDPEDPAAARFHEPRVTSLRPHDAPVVERVPLAFDTAVATRSASGEVRVLRLREDGGVALAAVGPVRCRSSMRAAEAAPVIACSTDDGIARWDLRGGGALDRHGFKGIVLDVSPDGARVVAAVGRRVLLWEPGADEAARAREVTLVGPAVLGRWSPRDPVVALVQPGRTVVHAMGGAGEALVEVASAPAPASARWDAGGLDLAVCGANGAGAWHYLRRGGRAEREPLPEGRPCAAPGGSRRAAPLRIEEDAGELAELEIGDHKLAGGWKLPDGRALSRDLVLFGPGGPVARRLLHFEGQAMEGVEDEGALERRRRSSSVAVVRDEERVAWQSGGEVRLHEARDGRLVIGRKGNLLRRCNDGRIVAWRRAEKGVSGALDGGAGGADAPGELGGARGASDGTWDLFDVSTDAVFASVPRAPGFVLGVDAACATLFTQELDGNLVATPLAPGVGVPQTIAVTDGYVYEARPSAARGDVGSGLLVAFSSGAVARIDDGTGEVRVLGYATPLATAIGDGPAPGEGVYADATGVVLVRRSGVSERVLEGAGGATWEDMAAAPDGRTLLLSSVDRLAVLDLDRRELVGMISSEGHERLAPWDDEGSVLAWSFGLTGEPEGLVIPRGLHLARAVAAAVSNLKVKKKRLVVR